MPASAACQNPVSHQAMLWRPVPVIRAIAAVAVLGAVVGCTTTDRSDPPRAAGSAPGAVPSAGPAAAYPQGIGPGGINAPYYQGADPNFPRSTRAVGKGP